MTNANPDVLELTDENFEAEVVKSGIPTLVDFWAVWCAPCRQIAPTVEKLATAYKGKLRVGKMDIDHHQDTPQRYGIRSIPTLLLFKSGKIVETIVGALPPAKIEAKLTPHLG